MPLVLVATAIACGDSGMPSTEPDGGSGGSGGSSVPDGGIIDSPFPGDWFPEPHVDLSLAPAYQLTPYADFDRFTIDGLPMDNTDFEAHQDIQVSAADKLDEVYRKVNR